MKLDFEKPITKIEEKIEELRKMSEESGMDLSKEIEIFDSNLIFFMNRPFNTYLHLLLQGT